MKPNIEQLARERAEALYGNKGQIAVNNATEDFIMGAKAMEKYYKSQQQEIWDAARKEKDWSCVAAGDLCYEYETLEDYLKTKQ